LRLRIVFAFDVSTFLLRPPVADQRQTRTSFSFRVFLAAPSSVVRSIVARAAALAANPRRAFARVSGVVESHSISVSKVFASIA
jgi:hypothetical protein